MTPAPDDQRSGEQSNDDSFVTFYANAEPVLRVAFAARYGIDRGAEATAEAFAFAWQRWDHVRGLEHPIGYLYRAGQSRSRRIRRPVGLFPKPSPQVDPVFEPGLPAALERLTERQRVCVVLAHGYGLAHREIAELLDIGTSSVQNHVDRAMAKLREALEENDDA